MKFHYLMIVDDQPLSHVRKKCIDALKARMQQVDTLDIVTIQRAKSIEETIYLADKVRFEKAVNIPNLVYVDTDCFLAKGLHELELKEGPYFGEYDYTQNHPGMLDTYLFYVNNYQDFFKANFNLSKLSPEKYSFDVARLKSISGYTLFNSTDYIHYYESTQCTDIKRQLIQTQKTLDAINFERVTLRRGIENLNLSIEALNRIK